MKPRIGVLTSGGDCPGLNAVLRGVALAAEKLNFEVLGFLAPIIAVRRRCDGVTGSLTFQGSPRFYFGFEPHRG